MGQASSLNYVAVAVMITPISDSSLRASWNCLDPVSSTETTIAGAPG